MIYTGQSIAELTAAVSGGDDVFTRFCQTSATVSRERPQWKSQQNNLDLNIFVPVNLKMANGGFVSDLL